MKKIFSISAIILMALSTMTILSCCDDNEIITPTEQGVTYTSSIDSGTYSAITLETMQDYFGTRLSGVDDSVLTKGGALVIRATEAKKSKVEAILKDIEDNPEGLQAAIFNRKNGCSEFAIKITEDGGTSSYTYSYCYPFKGRWIYTSADSTVYSLTYNTFEKAKMTIDYKTGAVAFEDMFCIGEVGTLTSDNFSIASVELSDKLDSFKCTLFHQGSTNYYTEEATFYKQ